VSTSRRIGVALAALALSAGGGGCGKARAQQECRLEGERVIAETGGGPAAVAAVRVGAARYVAAWSAGGRSWLAALDADGRVAGEPTLVDRGSTRDAADPADGGPQVFWPDDTGASFAAERLDLAARTGGGAVLGVLERRSESRPGGAFAVLVGAEPQRSPLVVGLGPAGPFSSRIAAVGLRDGSLLAWHDATVDASAVRLAQVAPDGRLVGARAVPSTKPVFSPTLAAAGDSALLLWIAPRPAGSTERFDLRIARVSDGPALGPSTAIAAARYLDPAPALVPTGDGFGVAFRDDRDGDGVAEYYYLRLDLNGAPLGQPSRISRADGAEGPRLAWVGGFVFGVQVRSFGGALLVGMSRFDADGRKRGGEFQIYADKSDFTHADVAPGDGRVLLVYAEDRKGAGRVLAGPVICRGR
jgi:hypothetical protein